jgi:hypothetical protein
MTEPPTKKQRNLADVTVENCKTVAEKSAERRAEDCSEIFFPPSGVMKSSYKLFEVPKDFTIAANEKIRLIGDDTNHAVLCTDDKTYAIKKVETSNSVFLVAPSDDKRFTIESLHQDYYEVHTH